MRRAAAGSQRRKDLLILRPRQPANGEIDAVAPQFGGQRGQFVGVRVGEQSALQQRTHAFTRARTRQNQAPIFAIEVSSVDSATYADHVWVPLCSTAAAQTMVYEECREYRFSKEDALWQDEWRALRFRCVLGGHVASRNDNVITDSGAVIVLE